MCNSKSCCCGSGGSSGSVGAGGAIVAGLVGLGLAVAAIHKEHANAPKTTPRPVQTVTRVVVEHAGFPWGTFALWAVAVLAVIGAAVVGLRVVRARRDRPQVIKPPLSAITAGPRIRALPSSMHDPSVGELTRGVKRY